MKVIFLFTSAALAFVATPAQAQLLGGDLGGGIGSTLGGAGSLDIPTRSIETATRGAGSAAGSTEGSQSVDRRSGRVSANRKASAQGSGSIDQTVGTPLGGLTGSGSGSARGSGSTGGDAQLVGTDALRSAGDSAANTARGAAMSARNTAGNAAGRTRDTAGSAVERARSVGGSASGATSGAADGVFSGAAGQLALAGSAAGQGSGMFDVAPGMPVLDKSGDQIGSVRRVIADQRGRVEELVVMTEDGPATIPADNFTGSGSLLVSAMGEGKLEKTARRQADEEPAADSAN